MATTTNKRRFEDLLECNTLHVKGTKADPEFLKSEQFEILYLRSPCSCCGSKEHSLLRIKSQLRTRSGRLQYEYQCPVAGFEDIEMVDKHRPENQIKISYWLDSGKYASECCYNTTIALNKFKELSNSLTSEYEVVMNRFKAQVLEICEENMDYMVERKKLRREILRNENTLIFKDTFLVKPCKICGSDDHVVLGRQEGTITGFDYTCPLALAPSYDSVKGRSVANRLKICPIKLAALHNNDPTKIIQAYEKVVEQQNTMIGERLSKFLKSTLEERLKNPDQNIC